MYNKKVLSTAKKELNKAKAPKKPKDMIVDPMGQWNHPGLNTRIPGNGSKDINITMNGVYKPLIAIADTGEKRKLYPGENHTFRGAKYVDEFPIAKKGGERKRRKTKSLSGTNKLMLPNPLLRNYKNRVYDPNVDYFQDGGVSVGLNSFVDRDEEGNMIPIVIPSVNYSKGNFSTDISTNVPAEHPRDYEKNINLGVGYYKPLGKRGKYGNLGIQGDASISNDPYYNVGLEYTTPYDKRLGLNFKASTSSLKDLKNNLNTSVGLTYRFQDGGFKTKLSEEEEKEFQKFYETLPENLRADDPTYDIRGYWDGSGRPSEFDYSQPKEDDGYYHAFSINPNTGEYLKSPIHPTFQHAIEEDKKMGYRPIFNIRTGRWESEEVSPEYANGGDVNLELTQDEIDQYVKGGYIVEDISIPELTKAQVGKNVKKVKNTTSSKLTTYTAKNNKDYAFRKKAYDDSLALHKLDLEYKNLGLQGHKMLTDKKGSFDRIKFKNLGNKVEQNSALQEQIIKNSNVPHKIVKKENSKELFKYEHPLPKQIIIKPTETADIINKPKPKPKPKPEDKKVDIVTPPVKVSTKDTIIPTVTVVQSKYPTGYQPYSLYGKVLDPERYGYGESNDGKPIQLAQHMDAFVKELQMEKYKKSGKYPWVKQDGGLIEAQTGGFKPIPLPLDKTKSETTQMVSLPARQAIQHIKNKPGADKAKKKEKKEIQKFKKQLWKDYEKLPLSEKVSDRIGAFFVDPAGMTARALTGEQAYLPGMGKGLLNDEHPEIRDKYLKELGYTKGEFDASDLQNIVNPFYWASSLVDNVEKGNYGEAGLEAVLMGLPHLPKGSFSPSTWKQGAKMLREDLSKGLSKSKPKSSRVTNIGLDTYSGDSFTPIRLGDDNYKYAGQEWYYVDPEDYGHSSTWKKEGLDDASISLNESFNKLPNYGKETFDVGDFNFKQFSEGDNALKDLYAKLSKQKQLKADDFYTDQEVLELANKYKKHLENLENFDKSNPLDPTEMIWGALTGKGNARDELFNTLYPNSFQPSFREKFLTPAQEQLLKQYNFKTGSKGALEKNSLKSFGDMFYKPQQNIESPLIRDLKNFDDQNAFFYSDPEIVVPEFRGMLNLSLDDIKKLSPDELIKYRDKVGKILKQQTIDRINNQLLRNKFTGKKAWDEITKYPGYYNKLGGLIEAKEGGIKTHKSKDGTVTNTITKANGDTIIQVKTKDGKYYEKLIKKSDALDTLSKLQGAVSPEFQALSTAKTNTEKQEKEAKQKFLKKAWSDYDKGSIVDKASDRVGAFLNDPFGMTSRAILGEQAYIPGMAQGLHNNEDPEVRNRYLKELGYTPGEFDASDVQNIINPGYWASSFTENSRKGNIGTAALEGALMFLPHLPKGSFSPLKNAYKYNPRTYRGYKPIETPRVVNSSMSTPQHAGFPNPLGILDRIIPRLPTPLNYFGVESSWNNVSPLNLIPGYGKKLFNKTDELPVGYRKFGNSLEHVKTSKTLSPKGGNRMGAKQIESEGNWAEPNKVNEAYNGVFEATMNPNIKGSNIKLEKWNKRNGIVGTTKEGDVAIPITDPGLSFNRRLPFSNKYVSIDKQKLIDGKFQLATQLPHVQSLIEKYGLIAGHAMVLGYMMGGKKGAMENLKTVNKYSVDPVIDWSKKQWDSFDKTLNKKKQGGGVNDAVHVDLTQKEIDEYVKGGYIVEDISVPELTRAKDGGIKTHKSKDGTITNTITKPNGDVVIQVKTKDGRYYEKVKKGLPQFMKDEFKKRAEWEDRSSGAAQPVDWVWTLPMGATSTAVKGAGVLLSNIGKSSLVQGTKAGTKALFNTAPKWAPGMNLGNALNATFAGAGINEYLDEDSELRNITRKAINNPTANNIGDAATENVLNLMNFAGLGLPNKVVKGAQAVKGKLPKYKNYYRIEPTTFKKKSNNPLTGRWIGELEEMPFYIKNLKDPNADVRLIRKRMKVSDWEKISGKNMSDNAKFMSIGTGEYDRYADAATAGLIPENIARRITKGVPLASDIEFLANNKHLYNKREGIISEEIINKIRKNKKLFPFTSWDRIEFSGDDRKEKALEYIFSLSNKNHKLNKNILGIPREYLPFKDGGIISNLSQKEINEYVKGGYIVEDVNNMYQEGGEATPVKELDPAIITPVSMYQQEYKDANSYDDFYNQKVDEYLRRMPKGLGKMMGIDSDRIPSNLIKKINAEYQYNMNNYVTDQVLKNKKYDIDAREEWVDKLKPSEYEAFANSKYTGKLKPNLWTRTRAGVRALGNTLLPGQPISYDIKGLTPREQQQYKEDYLAAFDALAAADLPGAWVGNYLVDSRNYVDRPDLLSGELNANLAEGSESLLNPLAYAEGVGVVDISRAGIKALKNSKKLKKLAEISAPKINTIKNKLTDNAKLVKESFTPGILKKYGDLMTEQVIKKNNLGKEYFKIEDDIKNLDYITRRLRDKLRVLPTNSEAIDKAIAEFTELNKKLKKLTEAKDQIKLENDKLVQKIEFNPYEKLGTMKSSVDSNSQSIDYLFDFETGEKVPFNIKTPSEKIIVELENGKPVEKRITLQDFDMDEEYVKTNEKNKEFVKNILPGAKPFGSSTFTKLGVAHASNDIDVAMTASDWEKVKKSVKINPNKQAKYGPTINLGDEFGDQGNIDVNIIQENPKTKLAEGDFAREIYRQFFPEEFYNESKNVINKVVSKPSLEKSIPDIKINKTAKELIDAYDPEIKSIIDAYESSKDKQINRIDYILETAKDYDKVKKAQELFAKSVAGKKASIGYQFPEKELNNFTENLSLLLDLGLMDTGHNFVKIASDPKRMQLFLNDFYINKSIYTRQITLEPKFIKTPEDVTNAFKEWIGKGGNLMGLGTNSVELGDPMFLNNDTSITGQVFYDLIKNKTYTSPKEYVKDIINQTSGKRELNQIEVHKIKQLAKKYNFEINENAIPKELGELLNLNVYSSFDEAGVKKSNYFTFDDANIKNLNQFYKELGREIGAKVIQREKYGNSLYATLLNDFDEKYDNLVVAFNKHLPSGGLKSRTERFSNFSRIKDSQNKDFDLINNYYKLKGYLDGGYETLLKREEQLGQVYTQLENILLEKAKKFYNKKNPGYYKTFEDKQKEIRKEIDLLKEQIDAIGNRRAKINNLRPYLFTGLGVAGLSGAVYELSKKRKKDMLNDYEPALQLLNEKEKKLGRLPKSDSIRKQMLERYVKDLKYKDGGIVTKLTKKQIDEYTAKGYIVEDVD